MDPEIPCKRHLDQMICWHYMASKITIATSEGRLQIAMPCIIAFDL